jgi:DNA-binding MarR family transcriptional regulator
MDSILKEIESIKDKNDIGKVLANLYYTHFWLANEYKTILSEFDLTAQQTNILTTVNHFHPRPLTLSELKEKLLEKNADVSRVVTRLANKKLINRKISKDNRRKVEITMTEKGINLSEQIQKEDAFKKFTAEFSVEDARTFTTLLRKLRKK